MNTVNNIEANAVETVEVSKVTMKRAAWIGLSVAAVGVIAAVGYKAYKASKSVVAEVVESTDAAEEPAAATAE